MGKYVWNTKTKCRVPYNHRLNVDGHPNLEWREEPDVVISDDDNALPAEEEKAEPEVVDEDERREKIAEVMRGLDPADKTLFTAAGLPDARVLTEKCGFLVSSAERTDIWSAVKTES